MTSPKPHKWRIMIKIIELKIKIGDTKMLTGVWGFGVLGLEIW